MKTVKVRRGANRIVFLFLLFGFVIKLPRIRVKSFIAETCRIMKQRQWEYLWKIRTAPVDRHFSFKWYLFKGVVENWREYKFYISTRHVFLWKTTFSFFGFINIQPLGEQPKYTRTEIWEILCSIAGNDLFVDCHHFNNANNFCTKNGKLRILDYSSKDVQMIIVKYGDKFANLNGSP